MSSNDAMILALFDDPGTNGSENPGIDSTTGQHATSGEAGGLVMIDCPGSVPRPASVRMTKGPQLCHDLGFLDPRGGSFLVVFSAGMPLDRIQPRTVVIPISDSDQPITELILYRRDIGATDLVAVQTFRWARDIRGLGLTIRLANPADETSWAITTNQGTAGRSDATVR